MILCDLAWQVFLHCTNFNLWKSTDFHDVSLWPKEVVIKELETIKYLT